MQRNIRINAKKIDAHVHINDDIAGNAYLRNNRERLTIDGGAYYIRLN